MNKKLAVFPRLRRLSDDLFRLAHLGLRAGCLGLSLFASAAFAQPTPPENLEKGTAHLRWWAVFTDADAKTPGYTLLATSPESKDPQPLIAGQHGCYDGTVAGRYASKPSGSYAFVLVRDDAPGRPLANLRATLRKGDAYTLSAVLLNGKATLRLSHEYPLNPDDKTTQDNISIFNAMADPPLAYQIGETAAHRVPVSAEPFVIPRSQLSGQPLYLVWQSRRKALIRNLVGYEGEPGPVTAVFFRNHYNQPTILRFTAPVQNSGNSATETNSATP